jgi:hypothetical protein
MSDPIPNRRQRGVSAVRAHQFFIMILLVLALSAFMVHVALSLYRSSGALQLDLSRPGYDSAREEAVKGNSEVFEGYSADGDIDAASLNEFDTLYKQKAAEALIDIDAFSGDALSDSALMLDRD